MVRKSAATTRPWFSLVLVCSLTSALAAQFPAEYRSADGSGNNLLDPTQGASFTALTRMGTQDYADGVNAPSGGARPSARAVSNKLFAQSDSIPNSRGASDFIWQWGQFLDHDIDLTEPASPSEPFNIAVPLGDAHFDPFSTGTQEIELNRSIFAMVGNPSIRQQLNEITSYIDASMVYGSDAALAADLRTNDGTGRLRMSADDLLPFDVNGSDPSMFLAGDIRVNEQNGLTCMHTLFAREHNYWAEEFATLLPGASGDTLYEYARAVVAGEIQSITYNEWLPILLGEGSIPTYSGYDETVDASISNEFSTCAFRFGHTMLSSNFKRLDERLETIPAGDILLRDAFFHPGEIVQNGIEPVLRGMARQMAQELDARVIDDVRNFLFGPPGAGGFDLVSLNIQRGRDHGLQDYNSLRVAMGLAPKTTFAEISSDPVVQAQLEDAFGTDLSDMDPWAVGLAEDRLPGKLVGELFFAILSEQFIRTRDGDRFWYQNYLPSSLQALVEDQTLAKVIRRNTTIGGEIQDNAFLVEKSIVDLGGGCGTAGRLSTSGGDFVSGNPLFALNLTGADLGASTAVLTFANVDPQVLDCGPCAVLIPEFSSGSLAVIGGAASLSLVLPPNPEMFGFTVQTQALVMTPGTGPCLPGVDFSATNRLELTVGR